MKKILLGIALVLGFWNQSIGQDRIVITAGEPIAANIKAISASQVIYELNGVLTAIPRTQVIRIEYKNGITDFLMPDLDAEAFRKDTGPAGAAAFEEEAFAGATVGSANQQRIYEEFVAALPKNRRKFHPETISSKDQLKADAPGQKINRLVYVYRALLIRIPTLLLTYRKSDNRFVLYDSENRRRKVLYDLEQTDKERKRASLENKLEKETKRVIKQYNKMRKKGWTYEKTKKRDRAAYWERNGGKEE